jgi:hypothetical protein
LGRTLALDSVPVDSIHLAVLAQALEPFPNRSYKFEAAPLAAYSTRSATKCPCTDAAR